MKKMTLTALVLGLLVLPGLSAQTYDRDVVTKTMRQDLALVNGLKADIAANKFFEAADKFYELGKINQAMLAFTPRKGTKAEWDRVWDSLISAAFRGVGACGEKDKVKAQKALDDISAAMSAGHSQFR